MEKLLIALVAAFLGGGIAFVILGGFDDVDPLLAIDPATQPSTPTSNQGLNSKPDATNDELLRLRREIRDLRRSNEELTASVADKDAQLRNLQNKVIEEQTVQAVQVANSLPPDPEVVKRGLELVASVKQAVERKDGEAVTSLLGELARLGPSAYPAYFEAWSSLYGKEANFNFWQVNRDFGNNLWNVNNYLFGDLKNHVLKNPGSAEVPPSLIRAALFGIDRSSDRSPEDRFELLLNVTRNASDTEVRNNAGEQLSRVRDVSLIPKLNTLLVNTELPAQTRAAVIENLASYDRDNVNWDEITRLKEDADPVVSSAARRVLARRNPPVTGYLIEQVFPNLQAEQKGLLVGDIITRYGGRVVDNASVFGQVRGEHQPEDQIAVEIYRDGGHQTIYLNATQMGVDGEVVRRR